MSPALNTPAQRQRVVCVFCGAHPGNKPEYLDAARKLGELFHRENIKLVYGGGTWGIMGELARTLVKLSGPKAVHGIIPTALIRVEPGHQKKPAAGQETLNNDYGAKTPERTTFVKEDEYGETSLVPDMHTRKKMMADEVRAGAPGSGFMVLPGGFGTLEEAMEMTTWNQLNIHTCGIVLLNVDGYWDGLLSWIDKAVESGFISKENKEIMVKCNDVSRAVEALTNYRISKGRLNLDWEDLNP
ncbi:hypothetical protein KEM56_001862 [Ascosphaera pollenicola]|nr:hypothetical protein KEM56_001862 [Ascosphaera pollenicola]